MSDKRWTESPGMYVRTPTRGRFKGAPVFCGRVWVKSLGKFKHFVLGTAEKKSITRLHEIQINPEAALAAKERGAVRTLTFAAVLEEFFNGYRTRGGKDCRRILAAPLKFFGERPSSSLTTADLDGYLKHRRALVTKGIVRKVNGEKVRSGVRRKVGESSLRKEIVTLNTAMTWAKRRALVPHNPVTDYERPKVPAVRGARPHAG